MRPGRQDLTRLADLAPEDDPARVALLIRSARQAPDEPLPLVKWRIQNTMRRRTDWNRRGLRLALVGALVFLVGGVVGAVTAPLLRSRAHPAPPEPAEAHSSAEAIRHTHRRTPTPAPPAPFADEPLVAAGPSVLPAPAVPPGTEPGAASDASAKPKALAAPVPPATTESKVVASRPSRLAQRTQAPRREPASLSTPLPALPSLEPAKTPIPAGSIAMRDSLVVPTREQNIPPEIRPPLPIQPDSLANQGLRPTSPDSHVAPPPDEHALLTTALRRLRTLHDPLSALEVLDDYRLRFPNGGLAPEAAMLRVEALLQVGRRGDALAELDRLSLSQMPNSDERYVLRGELRAAVGRWREALGDFNVVLRGHAEEEAEIGAATDMKLRDRSERALWGRALVRSHLGDDVGARADLQECLRRFPRGRFASEATRLLGGQR